MDKEITNIKKNEWRKKNTVVLSLRLNCDKDRDILAWIESEPNISSYLKSLIRKEIKNCCE